MKVSTGVFVTALLAIATCRASLPSQDVVEDTENYIKPIDSMGPRDSKSSFDQPESRESLDLSVSFDLLNSLDSLDSRRSKRHRQHSRMLQNTYRDMKKANGKLRRNRNLERMAQSTKICKICSHPQHGAMDQKVLRKYGKMAANIACTASKSCINGKCKTTKCGGCSAQSSSWSPVQGWLNSPPHRRNIKNSAYTRVGCAANKCRGSSGVYTWCYFA